MSCCADIKGEWSSPSPRQYVWANILQPLQSQTAPPAKRRRCNRRVWSVISTTGYVLCLGGEGMIATSLQSHFGGIVALDRVLKLALNDNSLMGGSMCVEGRRRTGCDANESALLTRFAITRNCGKGRNIWENILKHHICAVDECALRMAISENSRSGKHCGNGKERRFQGHVNLFRIATL